MKGTLPDEMSFLTEMRYFELQGRERDLIGTIPSGIGTAWTKVTAFLVNYNHLNGTFPFSNNPLLGTIFLIGNEMGGNLDAITALKNLEWLEAEENDFSGTLPEEITSLEYLRKYFSLFSVIPKLRLLMNAQLLFRNIKHDQQ